MLITVMTLMMLMILFVTIGVWIGHGTGVLGSYGKKEVTCSHRNGESPAWL
jgi:hypothetical protein